MTLNNILTREYTEWSMAQKREWIRDNGEMKVLSSYTLEGWDDVQYDAFSLGCTVCRDFDADLEARNKFSEFYRFIPKHEEQKA